MIPFTAGTYGVTPIGTADGGAYDAWNAWGGLVTDCDASGANCTTGWLNNYSLASDEWGPLLVSDAITGACECAIDHFHAGHGWAGVLLSAGLLLLRQRGRLVAVRHGGGSRTRASDVVAPRRGLGRPDCGPAVGAVRLCMWRAGRTPHRSAEIRGQTTRQRCPARGRGRDVLGASL